MAACWILWFNTEGGWTSNDWLKALKLLLLTMKKGFELVDELVVIGVVWKLLPDNNED